ncbi:DUF4184 family protein [Actinoplanes regularis]|uniref:DUF4184 family protein n=1 Tax=Actinoplanes regularis TaxID=52697 RepID=A0A239K6X5_9ACTN|nr:DUF4184 family protein [Actinoplanes regularis]GIE92430.1 hypothetical protein Are01nite_89100 [Actinoplanes regularis]SNT13508.1 protein of unknown function [Actinoplanes regularis]
MPFTAIHPAAVLPIVRRGLPVSALVIGAIAPDLPMVVPFPALVHFAHTPLGLATVDLVLGTIAFLLWQALIGPATVALAPRAVSTRIPADVPRGLAFHFSSANRVARVLAAVLIGAATHLLWDGLTHDWMWGPRYVPWLASRHGALLGWQWMHHVSDLVGTAIVVGWIVAWWRGAPERTTGEVLSPRIRVLAWAAILGPAAAGFLHGLLTDSLFVGFSRGAALGAGGLAAVTAAWWLLIYRLTIYRDRL